MSTLYFSCLNLITTNGGMFKSESQKEFLLSQSIDNSICMSGKCYNKSWLDFFNLDSDGVVEHVRSTKNKDTVIWNRNGDSPTQLKAIKKANRRKLELDEHNTLERKILPLYQAMCVEQFGYVVDFKNVTDLLTFCIEEYAHLTSVDYVLSLDLRDPKIADDYISRIRLNKSIMDDCTNQLEVIRDFRVKMKTMHDVCFHLSFME